jgi:phosphoglucomutase
MRYQEAYLSWLARFADDAVTVADLTAIRDDEQEKEDRFYTELSFGTAGMRGIMGAGTNRMNIYNVRRLTKGLSEFLLSTPQSAAQGVAIAYDSRRMSAEFAMETALVLAASGIKAYLFDALRPVPILSYAVRHLGAAAGVVITASHNPPRYNGYKVYGPDGAQLSPENAADVTQCIRKLTYEDCLPMKEQAAADAGLLVIIGNKEVDDDYIAMVRGLSLRAELVKNEGGKLKIVYTPLHGSGNIPVRRILREIGISHVSVVPEQEMPNPDFPTVSAPNPEAPEAFRLAIPLANTVGADVVFGTDPDCDRLGIAVRDDSGLFHTLTGNQIGCLLLYHILSSRKATGTLPVNGAIVKSIVSTELARDIAASFGVACFETLTGFKFIGEKIQQFQDSGAYTFLFGFEESFGYLSGTNVRDKDGVNASLLTAEAACVCMTEGITLYDRLQMIYRQYGFYCERVISKSLPGKDGLERIREIMKKIRANPPQAFGEFTVAAVRDYLVGTRVSGGRTEMLDLPISDAVYYELSGGHWLCIRPSGTEPKIKLYVNTKAEAQDTAVLLNDALIAAAEEHMR